jgi:hypothetical protein
MIATMGLCAAFVCICKPLRIRFCRLNQNGHGKGDVHEPPVLLAGNVRGSRRAAASTAESVAAPRPCLRRRLRTPLALSITKRSCTTPLFASLGRTTATQWCGRALRDLLARFRLRARPGGPAFLPRTHRPCLPPAGAGLRGAPPACYGSRRPGPGPRPTNASSYLCRLSGDDPLVLVAITEEIYVLLLSG